MYQTTIYFQKKVKIVCSLLFQCVIISGYRLQQTRRMVPINKQFHGYYGQYTFHGRSFTIDKLNRCIVLKSEFKKGKVTLRELLSVIGILQFATSGNMGECFSPLTAEVSFWKMNYFLIMRYNFFTDAKHQFRIQYSIQCFANLRAFIRGLFSSIFEKRYNRVLSSVNDFSIKHFNKSLSIPASYAFVPLMLHMHIKKVLHQVELHPSYQLWVMFTNYRVSKILLKLLQLKRLFKVLVGQHPIMICAYP